VELSEEIFFQYERDAAKKASALRERGFKVETTAYEGGWAISVTGPPAMMEALYKEVAKEQRRRNRASRDRLVSGGGQDRLCERVGGRCETGRRPFSTSPHFGTDTPASHPDDLKVKELGFRFRPVPPGGWHGEGSPHEQGSLLRMPIRLQKERRATRAGSLSRMCPGALTGHM
jgi:hypothetical protein